MERTLQRWFIGIAATLFVIGVAGNMVYDVKARREIHHSLERVVASLNEERDAEILQRWTGWETQGLLELRKKLMDRPYRLDHLTIQKLDRRIGALLEIQLTGNKGGSVTLPLLVKENIRSGEPRVQWAPVVTFEATASYRDRSEKLESTVEDELQRREAAKGK